ncbi:MAG: hypothetical protein Ct9H300mP7_0510 [Verrucomicrobiota bacterium]|nr:MAG: hypothetical protein Ct9H300mP7_0510 [Verrucomicrobiota bacterium]
MVNFQNLLRLARLIWFGADEMKRLTGSFVAWLLAGFLTYPAVAGPGDEEGSTLQIAMKNGVAELSVSFDQLFDWESKNLFPKKRFPMILPGFPDSS